MTKAEARALIRQRFNATSPEERRQWSRQICERLAQDEHLLRASTVMAFYPLADEPDILPLLRQLEARGTKVLLPEVVGQSDMRLRPYSSQAPMLDGSLGTKHPATDVFADYRLVDVVLVPGVAFDRLGHRLGRGRGFYDRFLGQLPDARKIAVAFPYQILESVPAEEHDITIDHV